MSQEIRTPGDSTIWVASSSLDGYFVALFISPSGDADAARQRAWEIYTGDGNRPNDEEWRDYHTDPRGLSVFEVGDEYVGADGEGHLEVDGALEPGEDRPGAPGRCEDPAPGGGRCSLPIGHGVGFQHRD
jgi:hypothetical protein